MGDRDMGFEFSNRLVEAHGFVAELSSRGRFKRVIDDQHSAVVTFGSWRNSGGGALTAVPYFGVGRRDINELANELFNNIIHHLIKDPWRPTVEEWGPNNFLDHGRPLSGFSSVGEYDGVTYTEEVVVEWVDTWIPRLIEETPSLPWVRQKLAEHQEIYRRLPGDQTTIPRMMNTLLDGAWTDADEEEFFAPWREWIENTPPEEKAHRMGVELIAAVRAWLDANPDGVERELAD